MYVFYRLTRTERKCKEKKFVTDKVSKDCTVQSLYLVCSSHFLVLHISSSNNFSIATAKRVYTHARTIVILGNLYVGYLQRVSFVRSRNCSEWQELNNCISSCFSRSTNSVWLCLSSSLFLKNSVITLSASFSAKEKLIYIFILIFSCLLN